MKLIYYTPNFDCQCWDTATIGQANKKNNSKSGVDSAPVLLLSAPVGTPRADSEEQVVPVDKLLFNQFPPELQTKIKSCPHPEITQGLLLTILFANTRIDLNR